VREHARGFKVGSAYSLRLNSIVIAAGDRLLEHCRIRSDAGQAIFFYKPFQFAGGNEVGPDVIEPDRLTVIGQCLQWTHSFGDRRSRCVHTFAPSNFFCPVYLASMAFTLFSRRRWRSSW